MAYKNYILRGRVMNINQITCGNYGGSCKRKATRDNKVITQHNAGYDYCVDCLDACDNPTPKEN